MDLSTYKEEYQKLLKRLYEGKLLFGEAAVTHFLMRPELRIFGFKDFFLENKLEYAREIIPGKYIDVLKEEHPAICGGVTEYLTKIKLARELNIDLKELRFFDDYTKPQYTNLSDQELAFAMYEPDIIYRSGYGYTEDIFAHKDLIIKKASELAEIAINLIHKEFPKIIDIDFHPKGYVNYNGLLAIKGDSDLLINNCLIDFKTKKHYKLNSNEKGQLFAYALNKYMRDGVNYKKVYFLNARYNLLEELVLI